MCMKMPVIASTNIHCNIFAGVSKWKKLIMAASYMCRLSKYYFSHNFEIKLNLITLGTIYLSYNNIRCIYVLSDLISILLWGKFNEV